MTENREVVHSINTSLERVIVEELIKGPAMTGHHRTLPEDTGLLNVSDRKSVV